MDRRFTLVLRPRLFSVHSVLRSRLSPFFLKFRAGGPRPLVLRPRLYQGLVPVRTGAKNIPTNNFEVVLNCTLSAVGLLQDVRPPVVFKARKQTFENIGEGTGT